MKGISFFHISDTHIGPVCEFQLYGKNPYACAERAVGAINSFNGNVDFVVHTGDVVNCIYSESIALARKVFGTLRYPTYYITGNHDSATMIQTLMAGRKDVEFLGSEGGSSYTFCINHCFCCLSLDARGPDTIDPHGLFDDSRYEILRRFLLDAAGRPALIFVHFPPLPLDSPWHDRDMLMLNGERLHRTLLQADANIIGVFFGHLHRHITVFRDGIPYVGAPSLLCQFGVSPGDAVPRFEPEALPGLLYVNARKEGIVVKEFRIGEGNFC